MTNRVFYPTVTERSKTEFEFKLREFYKEKIPLKLLEISSKIPFIGTKQMRKDFTDLKKIQDKVSGMSEIFTFFI